MAQDGAIDACARYGRVYCRRIVRFFSTDGDAVFLSITVDSAGWAFNHSASLSSSGRLSLADHAALLRKALSAASAPSSVSLTTPAQLPSRTIATTPGMARAPPSGMSTSFAAASSDRS